MTEEWDYFILTASIRVLTIVVLLCFIAFFIASGHFEEI